MLEDGKMLSYEDLFAVTYFERMEPIREYVSPMNVPGEPTAPIVVL